MEPLPSLLPLCKTSSSISSQIRECFRTTSKFSLKSQASNEQQLQEQGNANALSNFSHNTTDSTNSHGQTTFITTLFSGIDPMKFTNS